MSICPKKRGVTLIETLVVVAILSVLSLSLYVVFKSGMDAWSKSNIRLEVFQNARFMLDQFSRELPGTIVGALAADPKFTGANGAGVNSSDTLEFVTDFADEIYKIKYEIIAGNVLRRGYIENPADFTSTAYTNIELNTASDIQVSDIQFEYWDGAPDWTADGDWSVTDTLPESVKITLTLMDSDSNTYVFETKVYLPNSE